MAHDLTSPVFAGGKFNHPDKTADGADRASVPITQLETLWVNTGTLCNVECVHCYIESSPTNDRLAYLTAEELAPFLNEAKTMGASEIGFTGGEPFMNPDAAAMIEAALANGFEVLVLTNAMRPMMRPRVQSELLRLKELYPSKLILRVSIDHYTRDGHDEERGAGAFDAGIEGLAWLIQNGFRVSIAGRSLSGESEQALRDGFCNLFAERSIPFDANDPASLVIFPEMDEARDVPEITTACWSILNKNPADIMCATSRMLVKRKGAAGPKVLSCTLLPYDEQFEMGASLKEAVRPVKLNHPFCAQFCVLGGASCSG
ncbi:radical SAM protein [Hyphococcus flavus]|uniref:Radical SAM protein n=1 Tax=Hyphococcus flavus TaxID=1866326 RepID=A0AAE9ZDM6_9PROT|nr:radical SAM protein [Hyphococcus flavus]WDI33143.1 radical SAM protein [Hyphococcus flavus]